MEAILFIPVVIAFTAFWTLVDRKVPSSRIPFIYREKLWQNVLTNFVFMAVISGLVWYFL